MQVTLDNKPLTEELRLRQKRMILYNEFIQDIKDHENFLQTRCITFKNNVNAIDNKLRRIKYGKNQIYGKTKNTDDGVKRYARARI